MTKQELIKLHDLLTEFINDYAKDEKTGELESNSEKIQYEIFKIIEKL